MRSYEEIAANERVNVGAKGFDGFSGIVRLYGYTATLIVSTGAGWEHASICPLKKNIIPSWEDMCKLKDIIWPEDEAVIQIHPIKEEYVNIMPNCLHLWRCIYKEMVLPPSCLVGPLKGQTREEFDQAIQRAYEEAGEVIV